jgi:hypothetical protein
MKGPIIYTPIEAPIGSLKPEARDIPSAFHLEPVAAKMGIAMASPSGILCIAIANMTTSPVCVEDIAPMATATPFDEGGGGVANKIITTINPKEQSGNKIAKSKATIMLEQKKT